ncbi:MAG: SIS domain-containing protein [Jatrophihabitantaceae bacterium]
MSYLSEEIASQPDCWRQAAQLAARSGAELPMPGERIAVVGCGTSWFMAAAYANLRERAGQGHSDAFAASEFPTGRNYDRLVAITRSGTTTELNRLLAAVQGSLHSTVLTASAGTPVAALADQVIELGFADERSVVQTRFATSALGVLRAHLGTDLAPLASAGELAVHQQLDDSWADAEQITFLGAGWAAEIAREAALKLREAAQFWTESYPSMEYRHGPISIAGPGRLVWHFGPAEPRLAAQIRATGAGFHDSAEDPMVELILVQRLAAVLAGRRGLDPDRPRQLTRSVVLDAAS